MICADGLPPHLQLSLDCLDAGTVFTTTSHRYEVVLANHGLIPAVFQIQRADTAFSRFIDVQPSSGRVEVGGYQALQIALNADRLGNFEELITVHVVGAPNDIIMKFRWTDTFLIRHRILYGNYFVPGFVCYTEFIRGFSSAFEHVYW